MTFAAQYARLAGQLKSDMVDVETDVASALRWLSSGRPDLARTILNVALLKIQDAQQREAEAA